MQEIRVKVIKEGLFSCAVCILTVFGSLLLNLMTYPELNEMADLRGWSRYSNATSN